MTPNQELDRELEEIFPLLDWSNNQIDPISYKEAVKHINQAFIDDGWVHTSVRDKADKLLQDMTNLHANMKNDLLRLGMTPTPIKLTADFSNGQLSKLMTGQEWYDRFEKEIAEGRAFVGQTLITKRAFDAAKKAAGIE